MRQLVGDNGEWLINHLGEEKDFDKEKVVCP